MLSLSIMPGQSIDPGSPDSSSVVPTEQSGGDFASVLFLLTPNLLTETPAAPVAQTDLPQDEPRVDKTAEKKATAIGLDLLAVLFAVVSPAESAAQKADADPTTGGNPADAAAPGRNQQPISACATAPAAEENQIIDLADDLTVDLQGMKPDGEKALLEKITAKDGSNDLRAFPPTVNAPTRTTADGQSPSVARPADAEMIPPAVPELSAQAAGAQKKTTHDAADSTSISPARHESDEPGAEISAPRGFAIADAQVAAHVEDAPSLPSERSGFFSRDNSRGGGHETNADGRASPQTFAAHGAVFQSIETERPTAVSSNHSWSAVIERLATEISTQARGERQEISMRLEPPELGHVKIELALDGERIQARITTEFAEAGGLIQSHLQELRQALQSHSLDLVSVQVDLGGSSGFYGNLHQGAESEAQRQKSWPDFDAALPANENDAVESPRTASLGRGAVSLWA